MKLLKFWLSLLLLAGVACFTGCEDGDSDSSGDVGEGNDANLCIAIGDSITHGYMASTAWPRELGGMIGKTVQNRGVDGARTSYGVSITDSVLRSHPGYLLIYFGANDVIHGANPDGVKEQLRSIIQKAKANGTVPIIATLTPMTAGHAIYDGGAAALSDRIQSLASEEGVSLVNLRSAFSGHPEYLTADGLHPNDIGQVAIAREFANSL